MKTIGIPSKYGLDQHGLQNQKNIYWNLFPPALVEQIIYRQEGEMAKMGSVVVTTGQHTGRSPNDKYLVKDPGMEVEDIWWGKTNQPIQSEKFDQLYQKMRSYLQGRDIFVQDMLAGAHPSYQIPIRIITEKAWASLFSHNLFIRQPAEKFQDHKPDYVVIHCPDFMATPTEDGTNSSTFVILNFEKRIILNWWDQLCGRNQEIHFYCSKLCKSPERHSLNALFCKCRGTWRCCPVFWPFWHRQDHSFIRS